MTMVSDANEGVDNSLYVDQAYIREENGQYYAYVVKDGLLHKQVVSVGRRMHGYMEILSGLTREDSVAFPYGKDVKDGAQVLTDEGEGQSDEYIDMGGTGSVVPEVAL